MPGSDLIRRTLIAAGVYVAAAVLFTWPLALEPVSRFGAEDPTGDPSLHLWTFGWNLRALSIDPLSLLDGRVFDANIFHPASRSLAYSDHLLLQSLLIWPVYVVTGDLIATYNVLLLASLVASALAMHLLVRALVGGEGPAYVAGLIFGFAPFHFSHLNHIQLQALYFLPLSLLFLHRMFRAERRTDTIGLGVVAGLQVLSSIYYGIIGLIGLVCAAVVLASAERRWSDWRLARRGVAAAALAAAIALPWSLPYVAVAREALAGRNLYEASHASAVPASYLQAPPINLLYGRTGWLRPGTDDLLVRKDGAEQSLFPGFLVILLAITGAVTAPRGLRTTAGVYLAVAAMGFVLSLGPDGVRSFYWAIHTLVPGMQAIRAPARFSVLVLCALAVLAAIAVRGWQAGGARRARLLTAGVVAIIAVEFANGRIPFPERPALTSPAGQWLASQPGSGAVICLPIEFEAASTPCMLQSLEHGRKIVNGYSGLRPPFYPAVVDAMSDMPSAEALLVLHELNVEYVVSDRPFTVEEPFAALLHERVRFADDVVYQAVWEPALVSRLVADASAPPPEPGPPAFGIGESALYHVYWTNGPMNVPAGEVTLAIEPPAASGAFRFVTTARTASWVTRFFEVDARLETVADARLRPIRHDQLIVEGRRRVERQLVFDPVARQVSMSSGGGPAVALPLASDARDPLSALFYVRTLPLEPGAGFSLPLSDNGRPSRLDVQVGPLETIAAGGRSWQAWRVEPAVRQRVQRRRPPAITAWVSADPLRLPLLVHVEAAFGAVRIELAGYEAGTAPIEAGTP